MKHSKIFIQLTLTCTLGCAFLNSSAQKKVPTYNIYAGSTHAHTAHTWSHGSHLAKAGIRIDSLNVGHPKDETLKPDWQKQQGYPAEHFALAKASGYDFYITTDHSQEADFYPTSPDSKAWKGTRKAAEDATDSKFVALVGYEHSENNSTNGKGHINVINTAEYINALEPQIDLPYLYQWLPTVKPNGEGAVVASFNHPNSGGYNGFAYRNEKVTDIITLLEMINSNKNVHYDGFLKALDAGWKVSPVAGNDNHGLSGIATHTSRTFVLATARTKAAILDAMKNRRTYASFDQNIKCSYKINGEIMGSTLKNDPKIFQFDINVSDPNLEDPKAKITKIDIVKDSGVVVETYSPPTPSHSVTWTPTIKDASNKYFFVRVWSVGSSEVGPAVEANDSEESEGEKPAKPAKGTKREKPARPVAWLAPVWTGR